MIIALSIIAVLVYAWWPRREKKVILPAPPAPEPAREYELTFMNPDGSIIGSATTPNLPRHVYVYPDRAFGSDDSEPPIEDDRLVSFDRIGSSVHVDEERTALFVRRA